MNKILLAALCRVHAPLIASISSWILGTTLLLAIAAALHPRDLINGFFVYIPLTFGFSAIGITLVGLPTIAAFYYLLPTGNILRRPIGAIPLAAITGWVGMIILLFSFSSLGSSQAIRPKPIPEFAVLGCVGSLYGIVAAITAVWIDKRSKIQV